MSIDNAIDSKIRGALAMKEAVVEMRPGVGSHDEVGMAAGMEDGCSRIGQPMTVNLTCANVAKMSECPRAREKMIMGTRELGGRW